MSRNTLQKTNRILLLILLAVIAVDITIVICSLTSRNDARIPPPAAQAAVVAVYPSAPAASQAPEISAPPTPSPAPVPTPSPTATPSHTPTPKPTATPRPTATPVQSRTMRVTIQSSCPDYNHVGNDWACYFSVNGVEVTTGSTAEITLGETVSVYTKIAEADTYPDIDNASDSVQISKTDYQSGFSIPQTLTITENRGRYSGNTAVWTVTYRFAP